MGATVVAVELLAWTANEDFRAQPQKLAIRQRLCTSEGIIPRLPKLPSIPTGRENESTAPGCRDFTPQNLRELGGDAVEGALFTAGFYSGDTAEDIQSFVSNYTQKYGDEPDMFAANAYDSMKIVAQALENQGTTGQPKTEMAAIEDYPGITGKTSFAENGEALKEVIILKVENGKFSRAR